MNVRKWWTKISQLSNQAKNRALRQRRSAAEKQGGPRGRRKLGAAECLELRTLCAADFRSFDGTGNNVANPEWGSTDEALLRVAPADYADGISAPAGEDRASAREISNLLAAHPADPVINNRAMSAFVYAWGQFLDHDIDLTNGTSPAESFPIEVPAGDPSFDPAGTGTVTIGLNRSAFDPGTGTDVDNPREQVSRITAFLDGSQIYGSDATRAAALRSFEGGRLKTSDGDMLPFNTDGLANDTLPGLPAEMFYVAGDTRANENIELLSLHTLFLREHNRQADRLAAAHPEWNDERLYQEARRVVVAELQVITYEEFLPTLLGDRALPSYQGYNSQVNPGIANEFSTAAFRLGHSLLGDDIEFLDNRGREVRDPVALRDAFFNAPLLGETGIDSILKYLASDQAEEIDTFVVDDVRNFLFGPPGAGGLDLASLNIQRGRDHGLADYNSVREAYGLARVDEFSDITGDPDVQAALETAYGSVDNIDVWIGGLAESHVRGASVGPLFQRILADQFQRLRDGDRFWYQREFSGPELDNLKCTTLADIIRRNSTTTNLQDNVFVFRTAIAGMVRAEAPPPSRNAPPPRSTGLENVVVRLQSADGVVLETTRTARDGSFRFNQPELGDYRVVVEIPAGWQSGRPATFDVAITRGGTLTVPDVVLRRSSTGPVAPTNFAGPGQSPSSMGSVGGSSTTGATSGTTGGSTAPAGTPPVVADQPGGPSMGRPSPDAGLTASRPRDGRPAESLGELDPIFNTDPNSGILGSSS